jgi:CelD/BcsL family acetyltransferase involved in cellulose biosynthesis
MIIEPVTSEEEWEDFVANCPQGTFYHSLNWKRILEEALGYETLYLVVRTDPDGEVIGVCPFTISKKLGLFKVLNSLPSSDYAGPLIKEEHRDSVAPLLREHLGEVASEKGITYAKIRCADRDLYDRLSEEGSELETLYGTMDLDLEETPSDFIWKKVFNARDQQRTLVNRFEKDGFWNREAESIEDLHTFYELYVLNMKHIGASAHSYSFFETLWNNLYPDHFNILLTTNEERCVGAEAILIYPPQKVVYQPFVGYDRKLGTRYHTHHFLS